MNRSVLSLASVFWLLSVHGSALHGQAGGPEPRWQAAAIYLHQDLPDQQDWRSATLLVGRSSGGRTVLLDVQVMEREGIREDAWGGELYQDLATRGFVHLRGQVAPGADVLPRLLAAVDVYPSLSGGWEGWAGYTHRSYPRATVHTFGAGPALYVEQWYLRARPSVSRGSGATTAVGKLFARRFIDDSPIDYVELGAGFGSEFVEIVPTGSGRVEIDACDTWLLSVRGQRFVTGGFGVTAGGVYQRYDLLGARPTFTIGVLGRW